MREPGGMRDAAGSGSEVSGFGAPPAACPWGCVLGPGGWSGGPIFWYCPSRLEGSSEEEEKDEEEWMAFGQPWDVSSQDSEPPYSLIALRPPFLGEGPRPPPSALEAKLHWLPVPWGHRPTAEEAERNARELLAEEERAKRKAEKKKLKKKKQKDRKKQEKLGQELQGRQEAESSPSSPSSAVGTGHPPSSGAEVGDGPSPCLGDPAASSGDEGGGREAGAEMEDELDLSCSFVCKARRKAGVRLPAPGRETPARGGDAGPGRGATGKAPDPVPLDASVVEQSLILAGRGNEAAQQGRYAEAVRAFTAALELNPGEHRLLGNRSFCYEKLRRYEEALGDAQAALGLRPGWPKGFFRKGKALRGLQRYAEAAAAFEELLRLDGAGEAAAQLEGVRALLRQSHPHGQSSPGGVPASPSQAEEPPLPPSGERARGSCRQRDPRGSVPAVSPQSLAQGPASDRQTLPPSHPARGCFPLWVGNVGAGVGERVLRRCFGRFGEIRFVRTLPERRCAFVNYARKAAAEAAYAAMQDAELGGCRLTLQLKHPSHATPAPRQPPQPRGGVGAPPRGLL